MSLFALLAAANAGYISDEHYAPVHHHSAPVYAQKEIFTPAVAPVYAHSTPVVHKSLSAYATPVVQKTVEYAAPVQSIHYATKPVYAHEPHYAYEPHHHHVHSHTQAYPIAAKTIEYAPAHVAKTIEYAPTHVSYAEPSYGQTHQSIHHGHHGTVSHYGKTVVSPHSHVQKYDTRITNDHYKVAAVAAVAPIVHHHHEPAYHHVAPVKYATQAVQYAHAEPIQYAHAEPVQYAHAAPVQYAHAQPVQYAHTAPLQYAHTAPVVAKAAVAYSPASAVSHTSFQSADAHYSW